MLRQRRSREDWKRLVAEFKAGALTRQEFAAERGVNWRTFENWCYRLRREHRDGSGLHRPAAVRFVPVKLERPRPTSTSALATPAELSADVIEVRVKGMRLRFRTGVDSDYVGRLLAALSRGIAC